MPGQMHQGGQPMGYPPGGPGMMGPTPKKGSAGGKALIGVGVVILCGFLFFGYFSWANAQSAERLSRSIGPKGGDWVVELVRKKSERQRNYAIILGVLGFAFVGGGIALNKKAKGGAPPLPHQGMQQPGMPHQGMQQPGMPHQGMQQPHQGGPPGGYPPQGGGGTPQS